MYVKDVMVQNQVGLHARPATFFIQKANEFKSTVWVEKEEEIKKKRPSVREMIFTMIPILFLVYVVIERIKRKREKRNCEGKRKRNRNQKRKCKHYRRKKRKRKKSRRQKRKMQKTAK